MRFSIIIPTYNRPAELDACLQSLAELDYPKEEYEVIVVDDGGQKRAAPVVEKFMQHIPIKCLIQSNQGPAAARNRGAGQAEGQFLVFTDDDCQVERNWLSALEKIFASASDIAVVGKIRNTLVQNVYAETSQLLIDYLINYYHHRKKHGFAVSSNFAVPRDRFRFLRGFDEDFRGAGGEDRDFGERWLSHGYQMIFAEEVRVRHRHSLTLISFWKQHFDYGKGASLFHLKRSQKDKKGFFIERPSFYWDLLRYPFQLQMRQSILLLLLLLVSQSANAVGFFAGEFRRFYK